MSNEPSAPEKIHTKPLVFKVAPAELNIKQLREDILGTEPNKKISPGAKGDDLDISQMRRDILDEGEKSISGGGWKEGQLNAVSANEEIGKRDKIIEEQQGKIGIDPLTGLANREEMNNTLISIEKNNSRCWIALFDIDHFKEINDTYGHPVGDEVLKIFAQRLSSHLSHKKGDLIFRLGGEEILVIIPDVGQPGVVDRIDGLREEISSHEFMVENEQTREKKMIPLTVSAGVAHRQAGESSGKLYARVDMALYDAKHQGRNRVVQAKLYV